MNSRIKIRSMAVIVETMIIKSTIGITEKIIEDFGSSPVLISSVVSFKFVMSVEFIYDGAA